jgi:hypothetical protein
MHSKPTTPLSYSAMAEAMIAALARFDATIGPQGLYAAEEHGVEVPRQRLRYEWEECLMPCLRSLKCHFLNSGMPRFNWHLNHRQNALQTSIEMPGSSAVDLDLARISKIKVRKFGDSYRIDPHMDFSERWAELKLASYLKQYSPTKNSSKLFRQRIFLLIGFDGHRHPFRKEICALREARDWAHFGWTLNAQSWPDPHHRGFNTFAAIWTPTPSPSLEQS